MEVEVLSSKRAKAAYATLPALLSALRQIHHSRKIDIQHKVDLSKRYGGQTPSRHASAFDGDGLRHRGHPAAKRAHGLSAAFLGTPPIHFKQ
jgi:hypothetical protein